MFKLSVERPKKQNTIKTIILLYFTVISVLLLTACSKGVPSETAVSVEQETVKVKIKTPRDVESTIAPGRHFKVSGVAVRRDTGRCNPQGDASRCSRERDALCCS